MSKIFYHPVVIEVKYQYFLVPLQSKSHSIMNHSQIIALAKQNFSRVWGMSFLATLLYSLLNSATQSLYIFYGPLAYGYTDYIRQTIDTGNTDLNPLISGFNRFVETMVAGLLYVIIVCIGLCLLIVPGIIAAIGLSMTFIIMADNPNISGVDAIKKSWEIMKGNKTDYFLFGCRFIGWWLLCFITFWLAAFFVMPYFQIAKWHYYRNLTQTLSTQPPIFIQK